MLRYDSGHILRLSLKIWQPTFSREKARRGAEPPGGRRTSSWPQSDPSPYATFRRSVADGYSCRKPIRFGLLRKRVLATGVRMRVPFRLVLVDLVMAIARSASSQERAYFV